MPAGSISVPQIIPLRIPYGRKKHVITSLTPLEIKTDSRDCILFYTLNNRTPSPFRSYGNKYTYQYERPFTVAPGRVVVKAVALSSDGHKQSLVVTKTFIVQEGGNGDEIRLSAIASQKSPSPLNETSLSQQFRERLRLSSRESLQHGDISPPMSQSPTPQHHSPSHSPSPLGYSPSHHSREPSHRGHSPSRHGHSPSHHGHSPSHIPQQNIPTYIPKVSSLRSSKYGKCVYCSATITHSDHVYCSACGHQVPSLPQQMKEATRMAVCGGCRAEVVPGSEVCPVCDSLVQQPDPLPNILAQSGEPQEGHCCLHCGTYNSIHMTHCLTCDKPLTHSLNDEATVEADSRDTVMHPISGSTYLMCGTCGRVNVSDARYCDWCGNRPSESTTQLLCQSCSSDNDWRARFCCKCGDLMKCPLRPEVEMGETLHMPKGTKIDRYKWVPIADIVIHKEDKSVTVWPDVCHKSTQTGGQFYPSAKAIGNRTKGETIKKLLKETTRDRVPQLSLFSSGKGLVRNQVNHMCNHLKAFASGSKEFQDSIADHEIGKLAKGEVEEDLTNNQLLLHLAFDLKTDNDTAITTYQSPNIRGIRAKSSCITLNDRAAVSISSKKWRQTSLSMKVEDYLLAAELSLQGRQDIVSSLIEKGADINGTDTTHGLPMLLVAVANGHIDAMNTLIAHGVALDVQDKKTGNTALHETITALHSFKEDMIKELISHGANPDIRNKKNMTPCDLAFKQDQTNLIPLLTHASQSGDSMSTDDNESIY